MINCLQQFSKMMFLSYLIIENNQISQNNQHIETISNGTIVEYYTDNIKKKNSFFYQILIHL